MKHTITCLLALVSFALPHAAAAQSLEQKKLDVMVGTWKIALDLKATPLSTATQASGTETCEKFATHVVCRSDATGASGTYKLMRTLSYVPARKQYAAYSVDSLNSALLATGLVAGDTWTFTTNQPAFNIRLTLKTSATAYTALAEYAGPDGKFQPLSEVKASRVK